MIRGIRSILALVMLAAAASLCGGVPSDEAIRHDLDTIYRVRDIQVKVKPESAFAHRIGQSMLRQAGYLVSTLHPWKKDPHALSMTPCISNEHSIRPNAMTLMGLATIWRYFPDDLPTTFTRNFCLEKSLAMLDFVLPTHLAGGVTCNDGKNWFGQWQSPLWANYTGEACWMLWDKLSLRQKWLAARMICDEADRFISLPPPSGVDNDTKAEENAWDSSLISLAAAMFPDHPHHRIWQITAERWILSSFVRKSDLTRSDLVDGAPLYSWLLGPTIHEDFTLENHNRVHPDYMQTINLCLDQWFPYEAAGMPVPQALDFNTTQIYHALKPMMFPDGGYIYSNGQDWQLHRNAQWTNCHVMQAVHSNNPEAALMARICLHTGELMQDRHPNGSCFSPDEFSFPSTQMGYLCRLTVSYLVVRAHGDGPPPADEDAWWNSIHGVYVYRTGKFAIARSGAAVSTFSWGRQIMGMTIPMDRDLMIAPNERSLIGQVTLDGKPDHPVMEKIHVEPSSDTLALAGSIRRAHGAAHQRFAFIVLPDGRSIYADELLVTSSTARLSARLGLVSVLNESHWVYHDGSRELAFEDGKRTFTIGNPAEASQPLVKLRSSWYCIDDKLGIAVLAGSGRQTWHDNQKMGNGRLEQLFTLNAAGEIPSGQPAGKPAARTALVFYPKRNHEAVKAAAAACHYRQDGQTAEITLDDGTRIAIDFAKSAVRVHH